MRKIEKEMLAAVHSRRDWSKDNTSVMLNQQAVEVRLHGNLIAILDNSGLYVTHAGWQTRTTASRINALLTEFVGNVRYDWVPKTYKVN